MFWNYDITFCSDESCPRTDCRRHTSHRPDEIPVSVFLESPRNGDECRMYYGESKEK